MKKLYFIPICLLLFIQILTLFGSRSDVEVFAQTNPEVTGIYTGQSTGGATTVSTDSTVPGGSPNLYLVAVATKGSSAITGVQGLGLAWQEAAYQCGARAATGISLWWAAGNPNQDGIVTATLQANASLRSSVLAVALIPNQSTLTPLVTANTLGINGACSGGIDTSQYSVPVPSQSEPSLIISAVSERSVAHEPTSGQEELLEMKAGSGGDIAGLVLQSKNSNGSAFDLAGTFSGAVDYSLAVVTILGLTTPTISGDVTGDGKVDFLDFLAFLPLFGSTDLRADFNGNGVIDIFDFAKIAARFATSSLIPTPTGITPATPTGLPTYTPTPTPVPTSTPGPTPTQSPIQLSGSWISPAEVKALPITGQPGCLSGSLCANAWNALVNIANGSWGTPSLSNYTGLEHSQDTYAGALVAVRCESTTCAGVNAVNLRAKVLTALQDVLGTEQPTLTNPSSGDSLAPPRQFPRYVLAAELMGISNWGANDIRYAPYGNFVAFMAQARFTYPNGPQTFAQNHDYAASNGNTMTGFARVVSSSYLNNTSDLNAAWLTYRRYVGDTSVGPNLYINDAGLTWFYNAASSPHVGINPPGATCYGKSYPADGVIPADQGRGGNCPSTLGTAPGYTQYPWDGLQGIFAQAEVFKRKGYQLNGQNPFKIQNNALLRAVQYQWNLQSQFGGSWYDAGRAAWVKHLTNYYYGFKPINYDAIDGGRNVAFTQWTHQ